MRVQLFKQEYIWLAELARKAKEEAEKVNQDTPHPLLELRRDNMASLEVKINAAIQKEIQRERASRDDAR